MIFRLGGDWGYVEGPTSQLIPPWLTIKSRKYDWGTEAEELVDAFKM